MGEQHNQSNMSGNKMYGRVEWNVVWDSSKYFGPGEHTSADAPV